jgi:hypothetical protein
MIGDPEDAGESTRRIQGWSVSSGLTPNNAGERGE